MPTLPPSVGRIPAQALRSRGARGRAARSGSTDRGPLAPNRVGQEWTPPQCIQYANGEDESIAEKKKRPEKYTYITVCVFYLLIFRNSLRDKGDAFPIFDLV